MTELEEKLLNLIRAAKLAITTSERCPLIIALSELFDVADSIDASLWDDRVAGKSRERTTQFLTSIMMIKEA